MPNPEYVRLANQHVQGVVAPLGTGFSISGFDVQKFPTSDSASKAAEKLLRQGVLEAASAEEYKVAHPETDPNYKPPTGPETVVVRTTTGGYQEGNVLASAEDSRRKLEEARSGESSAPAEASQPQPSPEEPSATRRNR